MINRRLAPEGEAWLARDNLAGLKCPLPTLRARQALGQIASGKVLKVIATDPGPVKDFQAFAKQTGNYVTGERSREWWVRVLPA